MGFTSDACWFLLIKTLLIKNNKKREAALKIEAGEEEKRVFLLGLKGCDITCVVAKSSCGAWNFFRETKAGKVFLLKG